MELLALGEDRRQHRRADGPAEVAQHVGQAGGGAGLARRDAVVVIALSGVRTRAWPMARTTLGRKNWSPALVERKRMFMKQLAAKMAMPTKPMWRDVEALHQQRHERDDAGAAAGRSRPAPSPICSAL